jgi:hypothetical protein
MCCWAKTEFPVERANRAVRVSIDLNMAISLWAFS